MTTGALLRRAIARCGPAALLILSGPALAVPLPVPRPPDLDPAAQPRSAEPSVAATAVPLPVPRPEEDGPALPPRGTEVFGPSLPPAPPAHAGEVYGPSLPPVPPSREAVEAGPPAPAAPAPPPGPPEPDPTCAPLLGGGKVVAEAATAVPDTGGCGIATPVTVSAFVLRDGRRVALSPPALMRCDLADRLADWIRDDVAPATAAEGDLLGIADAAAYVCRSRNWTAGARISEHARGNAIDILAFRFAKRTVGLKGAEVRDALAVLKTSACARFSTVLGPGSDAYHETDLHLDLEHRRNAFKLCQWDVP